jgi:hypothetical protein
MLFILYKKTIHDIELFFDVVDVPEKSNLSLKIERIAEVHL